MKAYKTTVGILAVLNVAALVAAGTYAYAHDSFGTRLRQVAVLPLPSRLVLEYVESLVRDSKPAPTEAAREYAYVASIYSDTEQKSGTAQAILASRRIAELLFPEDKLAIATATESVYRALGIKPAVELTGDSQKVLDTYVDRMKQDGDQLAWDGVVPVGQGKWVAPAGKKPFTPRAGDWKRWLVSGDFSVPAPPAYGSAADQAQIAIVREAVAKRTAADVDLINFWGGTPGTNTPSGIWQDQLYRNTDTAQLGFDLLKRDKSYAQIQKVLAQTLADSFMECWKAKYTYWTARPDMRIPGLKTAMPDPVFPGYVSGHSMVSKAAAQVLSIMVPQHADDWQRMALDARYSRLVAGIHFESDNQAGFSLGEQVGNQIVSTQGLQAVIGGSDTQ